jgi:hypothetical protein
VKVHVKILGRNKGRTPAEVLVLSCQVDFLPSLLKPAILSQHGLRIFT